MIELKTVLVPTDFSDWAALAFPYARNLAQHHRAETLLVHACHAENELTESRRKLEELASSGQLPNCSGVLALEPAADLLVRKSIETPNAVMVLSTHGRRGARRLLLGSTAEQVISRAGCPVMTVKHPEAHLKHGADLQASEPPGVHFRRFLVPTDFESHSRDALAFAVDLARVYGAEVLIQHVLDEDEPDRKRAAWEYLAELARRHGIPDEHLFLQCGDAATEIAALAGLKHADLVVQGTHGRRLLAGLPLGSVASAVVRRAPCAVLTLRSVTREVPLFEGAASGERAAT